ncbi:3-phosphoshikimate 1-carboxyvinyltransferase [soil metagenome]
MHCRASQSLSPTYNKFMNYPAEIEITPLTKPPNAMVSVPGSKSITNRALVLAALAGADCILTGALQSEDTEVMIESLRKLGFILDCDWTANTIRIHENIVGRKILATHADLFVANSGTSMRFLAAMVATGEGTYRLDGIARMRERPIQDLIDSLNHLGVKARSESNNGCPPIVIASHGLNGGRVAMKAATSSQFLSALMMAAPYAKGTVEIELVGPVVSEPYIDMTVAMMRQWGHPVEVSGRVFSIPPSTLASTHDYAIEPDASAASYFFAVAAIAGGNVTVNGMTRDMLQGDVKFVDALQTMGCTATYSTSSIMLAVEPTARLHGITIDMNAISDTVMTLAAVACFADGPTTIRNVAHIRHKETDRIAALATELRKLGVGVVEFDDGLTITPRPMKGCAVDTYNDHRMAMSLALIGLKVPGVVIRNPGCVAKTYPGFWQDFELLR